MRLRHAAYVMLYGMKFQTSTPVATLRASGYQLGRRDDYLNLLWRTMWGFVYVEDHGFAEIFGRAMRYFSISSQIFVL